MKKIPVKTILILVVLGIGIVALGYWDIGTHSFISNAHKGDSSKRRLVDVFADNADITEYRTDGTIDNQLWVDHMEHDKKTDVTALTNPRLLVYRGNPPPWKVRSKEGKVMPGGEQVELIGQVHLEHDATRPPQVLTSSRMTIFPKRNSARTDQPVTISGPFGEMTSVGMRTDMDTGKTVFLSKIRGRHEIH